MRRTLLFLFAFLVLACSHPSTDYVEWLYASMPLPDSLQHSRAWWEKNVEKTLQVREEMGWKVPEREFRHFVLPLRVNNESLDDFRLVYADTLCKRIRGMSLSEAALEINHWCHEQATYAPSDARTSSPMATVRRGVGRCGEESVLTVAALRAAGIPARQVYTPRWAHTDDNHAWVEVYTEDGRWHFLGACEPAPTLDNAWFNAPVSRALLLHTKVYGDYHGPEDVIARTPCYTEINVIRGYVPARRAVVTVRDEDGATVEGATVEFKIYNYAEFYTVASYLTGDDGTASLDTGLGDMLVWARKGDRFDFARLRGDEATVSLSHRLGEPFSADIDIVPPPENPIPTGATPRQEEANALRLRQEDSIRASHPHNNPEAEGFALKYGGRGEELLSMLSAKDRGDVKLEVLEDAIQNCASTDSYVASQRVELEPLEPFRGEILSSGIGPGLSSPQDVKVWVRQNIRLVDGRNPQGLRTAPAAVWRSRTADSRARDIFYVALCRTLGFPARIDPVTGKTQYRSGDGQWVDALLDGPVAAAAPRGTVRPVCISGPRPEYYINFTFTRLTPDGSRLMEYDENAPSQDTYLLDEGNYLLTCGSRTQDGTALVHLEGFGVKRDSTTAVMVSPRTVQAEKKVVGKIDMDLKVKTASGLSSLRDLCAGGDFLLLLMGAEDEPTRHAVLDLQSAAPMLNSWGGKVLMMGGARPEGLDGAVQVLEGEEIAAALTGNARTAVILPLIALCGDSGEIYYLSKGYNTSLRQDLTGLLAL